MQRGRTLEQQIAVFGEGGSGKTVLLSSFYGATQEPAFGKRNLFDVVADDIGQGTRLHRNYLGMRDSATPPLQTHFSATSYSFSREAQRTRDRQREARPPLRRAAADLARLPGRMVRAVDQRSGRSAAARGDVPLAARIRRRFPARRRAEAARQRGPGRALSEVPAQQLFATASCRCATTCCASRVRSSIFRVSG